MWNLDVVYQSYSKQCMVKNVLFSPKVFWKLFSFKQEKYIFDIKQALQTKISAWAEIIQALSSHDFTVGERKVVSVK